MSGHHLRKRIRSLRALTRSCATFLPSRGSLVAQLLCVEVFHAHVMQEEITVKTLFASTGFSTSGCRSQYAWLVENGYLVPVRSETDKRRQTVIPGEALKEKFKLLLQATTAD